MTPKTKKARSKKPVAMPFQLVWIQMSGGEVVLSTQGMSAGSFSSAAKAAAWLRLTADEIERGSLGKNDGS
jgi:hypothetical protein